ncbi:MAG: tripartite tricarboxylate transporter substrate binding protein [Gammaproteobacteria bacterium]
MCKRIRKIVFGHVAMAIALAIAPAHAQSDYPNKPIKMIVGFGAGGSTDVIARIISEGLAVRLGQPVVVDNRPGAAGNLSAGIVARSAPDGYTLYMAAVGLATTAAFDPKALHAHPVDDFSHISLVAFTPNVLVVGEKHNFRTVQDVIAMAKREPGKLSFGSSGVGGGLHLTGEMFKVKAGIDMIHVPYKGIPPAISDVIGGNLDMLFDNVSTSLPHIKGGRLRALAVTSKQRIPDLPDVPTMAEAGIPDLEAGAWFGVVGPARMPAEIVSRLSGYISAILDDPKTVERFKGMSILVLKGGPAEFKEYVRNDIIRWKSVVDAAGVKP